MSDFRVCRSSAPHRFCTLDQLSFRSTFATRAATFNPHQLLSARSPCTPVTQRRHPPCEWLTSTVGWCTWTRTRCRPPPFTSAWTGRPRSHNMQCKRRLPLWPPTPTPGPRLLLPASRRLHQRHLSPLPIRRASRLPAAPALTGLSATSCRWSATLAAHPTHAACPCNHALPCKASVQMTRLSDCSSSC